MVENTSSNTEDILKFHPSSRAAAALAAGGRLIDCSQTLKPEAISFTEKYNLLGTEEAPTKGFRICNTPKI
jgi:hypothetical protein